jgi:hypothetical protein
MLIKQASPLLWKNISWLMAPPETTRSRVVTSFAVRPFNNRHGIYLQRESNRPFISHFVAERIVHLWKTEASGKDPEAFHFAFFFIGLT